MADDSSRRLALPVLAVLGVASSAIAGWLYFENRSLREELATSHQQQKASAVTDSEAAVAPDTKLDPASKRRPKTDSLFEGLARASRDRPTLPAEDKESREQRRLRRRDEIRAFLGRGENESVEAYRERMVPLVEGGLAKPRARLGDLRKELEQAAEVSSEQSGQLDE
jgi:hypothetical protein